MNPLLPRRAQHRADLLALQRAIVGLERPVPCCDDPRAYSEDRADQDAAARRCSRCPVIDECRNYGLAYPREFGVYGGLTNSQRRSVSRRRNHRD